MKLGQNDFLGKFAKEFDLSHMQWRSRSPGSLVVEMIASLNLGQVG